VALLRHIKFIYDKLKNHVLLGVLFSTPFCIFSQNNLILNPSCEEASQIPNNIAGYNYCSNWWKPYTLSTDYYTNLTASTSNNFIPQNYFGFQNSSHGNYYIGGALCDWIYSWNDYNNFRHDFFAGQFVSFLEKDKIYQFEFWMSKAEKGLIRSNAIDLVITYDTVVNVNNFAPYGYKVWSEQTPMEDTLNWIKISTCFKAKGNEKAFAIGNFHEKEDVVLVFPLIPSSTGDFDYRYLDNFSLIECPTCCPDQFPPEQHVYVFSSPSAQNNATSMQVWLSPNTTGELKIYDSAGRLVAHKSYAELENNFVFENFAAGIYHFTLSTSDGVLENGKVMVSEF
jgi:hypothetical protein